MCLRQLIVVGLLGLVVSIRHLRYQLAKRVKEPNKKGVTYVKVPDEERLLISRLAVILEYKTVFTTIHFIRFEI